jgi:hypothetical protein
MLHIARRRSDHHSVVPVQFSGPVADEGWGLLTAIKRPGGGELGLYEPRHPTATRLPS